MTEGTRTMHPYASYISDKFMELDRFIFEKLPGIRSYVRYSLNGEHLDETPPWDLSIIMPACRGGRLREAYRDGFISLPNSEGVVLRSLISGPIQGVIYIAKRKNEYKIGKTNNLHRREGELRKTFGIDKVVHFIYTDDIGKLESYLHRVFARYRTSGEWFSLSDRALYLLRLPICIYMRHDTFDIQDHQSDDLWPISPGTERIPDLPFLNADREQDIQQLMPVHRQVFIDWPQDWRFKDDPQYSSP